MTVFRVALQQGLLAISDHVCIISESVVLDSLNLLSNQALASELGTPSPNKTVTDLRE